MPEHRFRLLNLQLTARQIFWLFALCHLVLWVVGPALVSPNAPLDVIEGYAWGHEWLLGTYKHPTMQAWCLEMLVRLFGRHDFLHFLASQIAIVTAFWAVWQLGLRMLGPLPALVGALMLEGIVYYNFTSTEFNPNVLQIPFWALISLFYYRSVKDGKLADWLLLGVWSAGGLYSKYSTVVLLAALMILTLARPEGRRHLSKPGPWLALLVVATLFEPHLRWLIKNHWQPLTYANDRMQPPRPQDVIHSYILSPILFAGSQLLAVLPFLLLFVTLLGRDRTPYYQRLTNFDKTFLTTITFGPCLLVMLTATLGGLNIHNMWATPFWNFLPLWGLTCIRPRLSSAAMRRFAAGGVLVFIGTLWIYIGGALFYPYATGHALRVQFPGRRLASTISSLWTERYQTPLSFVIGDTWPAGNIAYYGKGRPRVFIDGNTAISPWIDPAQVEKQGGVLVWCIQHCSFGDRQRETPDFIKAFPRAEMQPPLELRRQTGADIPPVIIGWAILPPE